MPHIGPVSEILSLARFRENSDFWIHPITAHNEQPGARCHKRLKFMSNKPAVHLKFVEEWNYAMIMPVAQ